MSLDKNNKIEELLRDLSTNPENQNMTSTQLIEYFENSGLFNSGDLSDFRKIEADGISANNAFKNSILSKVAYTTFNEAIDFIHRQKENGITPTVDEIIKSGTLNNEMSALDVASLAYYSKTFTPINVMEEGQFTVKDFSNLKTFQTPPEMNMSYFRGVYRADSNIAMAMTVMSLGQDGKPELNVAFRGTDDASENMMVEKDGTTVVKRNSLATYMTSVYPNMEQHGKAAFTPLFNAIKNGVENYNWDLKDKNESLNIVATGHSLGGAMVEEWTKENSRSPEGKRVIDKGYREQLADDLMKKNKDVSFDEALKIIEDGYLQKEKDSAPGKPNLNLKSIVFGAPPNTREGWGNEFTQAVNRTKERYSNLVDANRERSSLNIFGKITSGASFILSMFPEMSKVWKARKRETTFENKILNDRDHKVLDRDFQVYSTPGDPVAKLLVKMNFAKEPSNLNVVQPKSQKDELFSVAIQPVVEQGNKDIVGPVAPAPENFLKRKPIEVKNGFVQKTGKILATVSASFISAITGVQAKDVLMLQDESPLHLKNEISDKIKGVIGLGVKTGMDVVDFISPSIKSWKKNNLDITNHNMKAYSATMLMEGSPIRNWINQDDMTPFQKAAKLVELKAKKDLLAMEVIVKQCGVEEVVRTHKSIKDNPNPIAFEELCDRGNVWVVSDEETNAGKETSLKFHELKEMFGQSIDLTAKETSNIHMTKPLSDIIEKENKLRGLPENIVAYTGFKTEAQLKAEVRAFNAQRNKLESILKSFEKEIEQKSLAEIDRIRSGYDFGPTKMVHAAPREPIMEKPPSMAPTTVNDDSLFKAPNMKFNQSNYVFTDNIDININMIKNNENHVTVNKEYKVKI